VGIDLVLLREAADLVDSRAGGTREPQRLGAAISPLERDKAVPKAHRESTVAATCTPTADVRFDQHHLGTGFELLDPQRRPEPAEAASDNAHVGSTIAVQRRRGRSRRDLPEPPASH
jgi:hypothetical protein